MKNQLNAALTFSVMPDRTILPEWEDAQEMVSENTIRIQNTIYESFIHTPESWLFYLGFYRKDVALSPSVEYFIRFSRLFIHKLSQMLELETLRHKVVVEISDPELDQFVENVPMITGAEYVNHDMLKVLWTGLGEIFSNQIREYDGSVVSFFHKQDPSIHLAGRVFFHLVENRNSDLPFAFMATY